jgi:hypothetical protein
MPRKKQVMKARYKNIKKARNTKVQRSQGELHNHSVTPALVLAEWANKKYHGHRILPPDMIALVKETIPQ